MKQFSVKRLVVAALLIAIGFVLPFLTGQIGQLGRALSPLHIPALLAGFILGWPYGLLVGFLLPVLRSLAFGMPPLVPVALAMAFECAAYGLVTGILYEKLPKKPVSVYVALIAAMVIGRVVGGVANTVLLSLKDVPYGIQAFFADYFVGTWVGMVVHIVLIPPIVFALERAQLIPIKD